MTGRATSSSARRSGGAGALWLLFGPAVWAVHFTLLYGAHTLLCALAGGAATRVVPLVVITATAAALAILTVPLVRAPTSYRRPPPDPVSAFIRSTTVWLLVLSVIAVLWAGATALIVTACGSS
jgi:hypothetical protein